MSVVATLIAGGAVLPWAAPEVRDWMAGLVPDQGTDVVRIEDPPVAPSTEAFIGPVGVSQQAGSLAGVRLEAAGPPLEVRIPRLGVDSSVVPISGQSGTLLPPDDPQLLGWWQEGKPVGAQYGTSVVTGHAVHTGGGALDQLGELVAGDSLRVRTDAGWIRYVVQRTRIYSKGALADDAESIFRLGGPGRLVLISCDDWNGEIFESNAVVYATPTADLPFGTEVPDGGPDAAGD
jgi:LPXTG-site transpeptidase (sortase) family protein